MPQLRPQDEIPKAKGSASGVYFYGVCAVLRDQPDSPAYAIIAADLPRLRTVWEKLSTMPLNELGVHEIALFRQEDLTEVDTHA